MAKAVKSAVNLELEEVVNASEQVSAFGRTYKIAKFTFGPMTQSLEYVGPMGYLLKWVNQLPRDSKGKIKATGDEMMELAVRVASISGPSVFGLVSVATQEPVKWLEQQDAMDGLKLFAKVLEKNIDFFSQENVGQITRLFDGLQQRIPASGGGSSTT